MILPGRDGRVYVSSDQYTDGVEAQRRLALSRTPTGYFEISEDRLDDLSEPSTVAPHNDQPGGGSERYVTHSVDASGATWRELS